MVAYLLKVLLPFALCYHFEGVAEGLDNVVEYLGVSEGLSVVKLDDEWVSDGDWIR